MEKFEKLVIAIMKEAEADGEPVTREEAEEMAKMEINANSERRYEMKEEKKERKPKERKVDMDKKYLLDHCYTRLMAETNAHDFNIKTETELSFIFNGSEYTLKLTKHRPKK